MKELKKQFNKIWWNSMLSSFMMIVIGFFLLIKPTEIIYTISMIVGIGIIIMGIYALLQFFTNKDEKDLYRFNIIYGIICIIAGGMLLLKPEAVASILPFVLGIWMTVNGIIKLQYAMNLKKYDAPSFKVAIILAFIMLAAGILFLFNPFRGATILLQLLGGVITAYSIIDLVTSFVLRKDAKKVENLLK